MYAGSIPTSASKKMKNSKILITGSCGFIGFHLTKTLLELNYDILGIDNLNDYYSERLKLHRLNLLRNFDNFTFHKIDLVNKKKVEEILDKFEPDTVINLAAQAGVRYSFIDPFSYINSNVEGFYNLINSCSIRSITKFIYASSSSVYGDKSGFPFKEKSKHIEPKSLYGTTKLLNEKIASLISKDYGLSCIGLRFFSVYGTFGRPDMAYYDFTKRILSEKEITLFNNGDMMRDMTYISDVIEGIILCLNNLDKTFEGKNEIFNIGNNYPIKTSFLLNFIENKLQKKAKIKIKNSEMEINKTCADLNKSQKKLGYIPKISFEEGMEKFIDWYLKYDEK